MLLFFISYYRRQPNKNVKELLGRGRCGANDITRVTFIRSAQPLFSHSTRARGHVWRSETED